MKIRATLDDQTCSTCRAAHGKDGPIRHTCEHIAFGGICRCVETIPEGVDLPSRRDDFFAREFLGRPVMAPTLTKLHPFPWTVKRSRNRSAIQSARGDYTDDVFIVLDAGGRCVAECEDELSARTIAEAVQESAGRRHAVRVLKDGDTLRPGEGGWALRDVYVGVDHGTPGGDHSAVVSLEQEDGKIRVNHVSIQEKGDHPQMQIYLKDPK